MFFSFSSSAKGQTTQTTPLIEARKEKTREFQTQLLHYFSKSDNKSNHHHEIPHLNFTPPPIISDFNSKWGNPSFQTLCFPMNLVYVCNLLRISVMIVLVFESRFWLGYCDQFYSTNSFFWESDPLSHGVSSLFAKYHTTSDYHMVSHGTWFQVPWNLWYHKIYGTCKTLLHALWIMKKYLSADTPDMHLRAGTLVVQNISIVLYRR